MIVNKLYMFFNLSFKIESISNVVILFEILFEKNICNAFLFRCLGHKCLTRSTVSFKVLECDFSCVRFPDLCSRQTTRRSFDNYVRYT